MLSIPCNPGFINTRLGISQAKANAKSFIKEIRNNRRIDKRGNAEYVYSTDVVCAVCQKNTLVPSDIDSISKHGMCAYCYHCPDENATFISKEG